MSNSSIVVVKDEKRIFVDPPDSSVAVINAGPKGSVGPVGNQGLPGSTTGYATQAEVNAEVSSINARVTNLDSAAAITPWAPITLYKNTWNAYSGGGGYVTPRYRRIHKVVYLEGLVTGTSSAAADMFELPAGFRPSENILFATATGAPDVLGRINISAAGLVGFHSGSIGYVSLSGIKFVVD